MVTLTYERKDLKKTKSLKHFFKDAIFNSGKLIVESSSSTDNSGFSSSISLSFSSNS